MRVGHGLDAHRFGGDPPIVLGGVVVDDTLGLEATSDGDVAVHALIDALLGAAALGDLGQHFPSSDPRWHGSASLDLLAHTVGLLREAGWAAATVDVTIVAEHVRVGPHREAMRGRLAEVLAVEVDRVSVKATTTDGLGFTGRGEGLAAHAVATIEPA